jgi:hypothetical protein
VGVKTTDLLDEIYSRMTMKTLLQSAMYISSSVKDGASYSFLAGKTTIYY